MSKWFLVLFYPKIGNYQVLPLQTIVDLGAMAIKRYIARGGARGVMVILAGNGFGDTSSNPGRVWLHFT